MNYYDLCITWCWEFDADFIGLIDSACLMKGLSTLQITHGNLKSVLEEVASGQLNFSTFFDRTEHEITFEPVFFLARKQGCYRINPRESADWAEDKATMHLELISAGVVTPYTIILPPYNERADLAPIDLRPLGERFVIKPSYGGGGTGVVMDAVCFEDVLRRRTEFPHLKYLLQETITPKKLVGRNAWFRVIFCDGHLYPCWWDPITHVYTTVSADEETTYDLHRLRDITRRIATVCKLSFFSTEIAITDEEQWVVIDYVNDQIDMRLQSKAMDGVPDSVVNQVVLNLAGLIYRKCASKS